MNGNSMKRVGDDAHIVPKDSYKILMRTIVE